MSNDTNLTEEHLLAWAGHWAERQTPWHHADGMRTAAGEDLCAVCKMPLGRHLIKHTGDGQTTATSCTGEVFKL